MTLCFSLQKAEVIPSASNSHTISALSLVPCNTTQHWQHKSVPFISVAFKCFHVFRDCCVFSTFLMFFCLETSSAAMGYGVFKKVWRVMTFFKEDCRFCSFPFTSGCDYILGCSLFCCLCCSCDVYFYLYIYISPLWVCIYVKLILNMFNHTI